MRFSRFTTAAYASLTAAALAGGAGAGEVAERPDPGTVIATGDWYAVNDGVMGGKSRSEMTSTPEGTLRFGGDLSLANNGGFASVRTTLADGDLSRFAGLEIRVRGDGRHYQLRLRTDDNFDGIAYRAHFGTVAGQWMTVRLHFAGFEPSFRGRVVAGMQPLDTGRVRQLSFMTGDKQPGPFNLEIASIVGWPGNGSSRD